MDAVRNIAYPASATELAHPKEWKKTAAAARCTAPRRGPAHAPARAPHPARSQKYHETTSCACHAALPVAAVRPTHA